MLPTFGRIGVLRYVFSEGRMGRLWLLHPEVKELPGIDCEVSVCKAEDERVLGFLLADLHQLEFVYSAFASALQQLWGRSSGGQ